jgi:hypothetical protein
MFRIACIAALVFAQLGHAQTVLVDFEDLVFSTANYTHPNPALSGQAFMNGQTLSQLTPPQTTFTSRGATFNTSFYVDPTFGPISGIWAYSNIYNSASVTFTQPNIAYNLAASAGVGTNGANASATYAVLNNDYLGEGTINLPEGYRPTSIQITNTTYAAITMRDGDVNGFARRFGLPDPAIGADGRDWFKLTIIGRNTNDPNPANTTGAIDFYLADFRSPNSADHYIIDRWTSVDLSPLGAGTNQLQFLLASTDNSSFVINGTTFEYMNTPAYFAADNLLLTPIPEPGLILGLAAGAGILVHRKKRRAK